MADEIVSVLAGSGSSRLVVRRSQFHGRAAPVATREALASFRSEVRSNWPGARHVPYGWISEGSAERSSDDGEPSGTGGRPCLDALRRRELRGAAVAVARIFGGTLLGAANLARAYAEAAAAAVEAAGVVERPTGGFAWIGVAHGDVARAERALAQAGARVAERRFADGALLYVWVPSRARDALRAALPQAAWRDV